MPCVSSALPLSGVVHQLGVEAWPQTLGHHALDHPGNLGLRIALTVDKPDGHASLLVRRLGDDALDLAMDGEGLVAAGDEELEQELGPDRERTACLDERAATRDVLGVVGEERVEPLVFDLQLDRPATRRPALLDTDSGIGGRRLLGNGAVIAFALFAGHASLYQD